MGRRRSALNATRWPPPEEGPARQPLPWPATSPLSATNLLEAVEVVGGRAGPARMPGDPRRGDPDDWPRFNAMSLLGGALLGQGRYAEAEPLIVAGYEGMKAREAKIPRGTGRPARGGRAGRAAVRGVGQARAGRRSGRRSSAWPTCPPTSSPGPERAPVVAEGGGPSQQTVGAALALDFSNYLNRVGIMGRNSMTVRAEPGAVLDRPMLPRKPPGLMFGATLRRPTGPPSVRGPTTRPGPRSLAVRGTPSARPIGVVMSDGPPPTLGPARADALDESLRPARHRRPGPGRRPGPPASQTGTLVAVLEAFGRAGSYDPDRESPTPPPCRPGRLVERQKPHGATGPLPSV